MASRTASIGSRSCPGAPTVHPPEPTLDTEPVGATADVGIVEDVDVGAADACAVSAIRVGFADAADVIITSPDAAPVIIGWKAMYRLQD